MAPGEIGVDVFGDIEEIICKEYRLVAPEPVKLEVQKLSRKRGKEGRAAKIALELMEREGVEIIRTERMEGDASIVELARRVERPVIATNDKKLREGFRSRSVPTLFIRTEDHVKLEGDIR